MYDAFPWKSVCCDPIPPSSETTPTGRGVCDEEKKNMFYGQMSKIIE